jgi:hypothetical protein
MDTPFCKIADEISANGWSERDARFFCPLRLDWGGFHHVFMVEPVFVANDALRVLAMTFLGRIGG